MLSLGRLAEFVFARHGKDVGFVDGFVKKILQQKKIATRLYAAADFHCVGSR